MTRGELRAAAKAAADAEMEAELAADEEREIIAELYAEEELGSIWDEPLRDDVDEELDAAFWEAMEKDD